MIAVVIGNGESRTGVDLNELKSQATLIGCNAIHREFDVDHLVCCDQRMVREVVSNQNSKIQNIYTREKYYQDFRKIQKIKTIKRLPLIPYSPTIKADEAEHWGSGPYAVLIAAEKFDTVNLIGFDLYGNQHLLNNVYKDSPNYLPKTANAVDPAYWIHQLKRIFQHFPHVKFKIFNEETWVCPDVWKQPNVEVLNIKNIQSVVKSLNSLYNKSLEAFDAHPS